MASGIRAEIKIDDPASCVLTAASAATDGRVLSVSRSTSADTPERVSVEFLLEAETYPETFDTDVELSPVFSYGSSRVYRFTRELGDGCPCECIERHGSPVVDVSTLGSSLFLTFHAEDMENLQAIIGDLKQQCSNLDVQRLLQSQQEHTEQQLVFVDRSELTARQLEVLETAHQMGYFDHPKRANAGEVADELGIASTTLTEHLAAAQTKLLDSILEYDER